MTVTYRTGYGTTRRTLAELNAWSPFANVHPEVRRRVIALMDAARAKGVDLGVGGAFRTYDSQKSLFLSRHNLVASGGCCGFEGKRYALISGAAHAAPPGLSYHEETVPLDGRRWGVALDMVGWENGWMENNVAAYGLRTFKNVNSEPWHIQPGTTEIPTSRSQYDPMLHTIKVWPLPSAPAPTPTPIDVPTPTLRTGATGGEVRELQTLCKFWGWYPYTVDGSFGTRTAEAVKKMQGVLRVTADGVYGPVTADALRRWLTAMSAL